MIISFQHNLYTDIWNLCDVNHFHIVLSIKLTVIQNTQQMLQILMTETTLDLMNKWLCVNYLISNVLHFQSSIATHWKSRFYQCFCTKQIQPQSPLVMQSMKLDCFVFCFLEFFIESLCSILGIREWNKFSGIVNEFENYVILILFWP